MLNSDVHTAGGLVVVADNAAQLNATISNAASSVASALYGASGKAVGALLASNKVSTESLAFVEHNAGNVTTGTGSQVVDIDPSTRVTLHVAPPAYGTPGPTAVDSESAQSIAAGSSTNVLIGPGYGTPDFIASADGHNSQTLVTGHNVQLGDGYAAPHYSAVSLNAPQTVSLLTGQRVKLTPFYALEGKFETGAGTVTLHNGDTVLLSGGYAGGGTPGSIYQYTGGTATLNLGAQNYATGPWVRSYLEATYVSGTGVKTLAKGDTVKVSTGYAGGGVVDAVYRYVGAAGAGVNVSNVNFATSPDWKLLGGTPGATYRFVGADGPVDVNGEDYADTSRWARIGGAPGATYRYVGVTRPGRPERPGLHRHHPLAAARRHAG